MSALQNTIIWNTERCGNKPSSANKQEADQKHTKNMFSVP